ncbi:MAG: hypothetical protein HZC28_17865 [Spirochaetes bacterium]|nr:hypothetical protein [Spirochaetota bacterium]
MSHKVLFLPVLALCAAMAMMSCAKGKPAGQTGGSIPANPGKAKADFGMAVAEGTPAESVQNGTPVMPGTEYTAGAEGTARVYIFTRITTEATNTIYHRFSRLIPTLTGNGIWQEVSTVELQIKSTNAKTWTYVDASAGSWRADVLAPDKKTVMQGYIFNVKGTSAEKVNPLIGKTNKAKVTLTDAKLCESVDKGKPVNDALAFSLNGESMRVYFWGSFTCDTPPAAVALRWSRLATSVDGTHDYVIHHYSDVAVKGKVWPTYYWINVSEGQWKVDVLGTDGVSVMRSFDFTVSKVQ